MPHSNTGVSPAGPAPKRGLQLDRVVLLGRTLEEYRRYFDLDLERLRGHSILDIASGVSSFTAESNEIGLQTTAVDPIYALQSDAIRQQCETDLEEVVRSIHGLETYRWDFYKNPAHMRTFRARAYQTFLHHRAQHPSSYIAASLPSLPFRDHEFNLSLVSYFLFVYEARLDWNFHLDSIKEIMRVTSGEARLYPLMTFDGIPSRFLDRLFNAPELRSLEFKIIPTDFEFLIGSNSYLCIRHRS